MKKVSGRGRRTIGVALAALVLLTYFSPAMTALRELPGELKLAVGQEATMRGGFPLSLTLSGGPVAALSSTDETLGGVKLKAGQKGESSLSFSLFGLFPIKKVDVQVDDELRLFPGGQAVGVAMRTSGVLVVGLSDLSGANGQSPARLAGVRAGDIITQVGGEAVTDTQQFTQLIARTGERPVELLIKRGEVDLRLTLTPKTSGESGARIGAWVRDSTAGVGTLSFYQASGGQYGALGHAITDSDTGQVLIVAQGQLMQADIVDIKLGQRGVPGELKGSFLREGRILGNIRKNGIFGIYGQMTAPPEHPLYPEGVPIGRKDAVHPGAATILCTLGDEGMREYAVEIVKCYRQDAPSPKSMVLKVTDPALLKKTGGIVQGMSGSPILQDGRLVGAVTHVYVSDPTMGYGLYIEWMLEQLSPQQAKPLDNAA